MIGRALLFSFFHSVPPSPVERSGWRAPDGPLLILLRFYDAIRRVYWRFAICRDFPKIDRITWETFDVFKVFQKNLENKPQNYLCVTCRTKRSTLRGTRHQLTLKKASFNNNRKKIINIVIITQVSSRPPIPTLIPHDLA
jgi:hypothetical protein